MDWSSDTPKYSMRYADAAHDYKQWNTEKPTEHEPKYGNNYWQKTPRPTEWKMEKTPKPTKEPKTPRPTWAKTPKPTWQKTSKPTKEYNQWEKTPRPTEYKQWEKENDYKEEMKRA